MPDFQLVLVLLGNECNLVNAPPPLLRHVKRFGVSHDGFA